MADLMLARAGSPDWLASASGADQPTNPGTLPRRLRVASTPSAICRRIAMAVHSQRSACGFEALAQRSFSGPILLEEGKANERGYLGDGLSGGTLFLSGE